MKSEFRCSAAARAACEFRNACAGDAYFFEGSECHQFNEEIEARLETKQATETSDKKQATNAERIRAMSDEELGKFLCGLVGDCGTCPATDHCSFGKTGMVKWVKLPAKEDDNG